MLMSTPATVSRIVYRNVGARPTLSLPLEQVLQLVTPVYRPLDPNVVPVSVQRALVPGLLLHAALLLS